MVVSNFDGVCVVVFPSKAYSELVVDADAVLAGAIAFQRFESVAWREAQRNFFH